MHPAVTSLTDETIDRGKEWELLEGEAAAAPVRPFLKWAGGKTRLLSRLLPYVPESFNNYFEPFLGGGAMFFAVRERATGSCHLADLNSELVNAWRVVRENPAGLLAALARYRTDDSEDFYYSVRSEAPIEPVRRAAWFLYLNQTSWNGLWRVNRSGEFNVPWGARRFRGLTQHQVQSLHSVLRRATVEEADFRDVLTKADQGDFVYLDPPYLPVSDTSKFYFYTERRFRAPDLRELAEECAALSRRNVRWVLSNRDTPLVRELFAESTIVPLTARRSVAAQNKRDVEPADSPEVIVIGKGA
jgi:DNA adenine methylase